VGLLGDAFKARRMKDPVDGTAQLERLAKLRDSGALTEEEFEREKARILGQ
jgi:hypothetical protein